MLFKVQDRHHGGDLKQKILAIENFHVPVMPSTKFL